MLLAYVVIFGYVGSSNLWWDLAAARAAREIL
jgi:hypothetical protein